jgi:predicted Zn-dependent protease with MMP-like domain
MRRRHLARIDDHHRRRFERLVRVAMRRLPRGLGRFLDNVAILTADAPTPEQRATAGIGPDESLLGLYEGIPVTQRSTSYSMVIPDRITLFRRAIEAACQTDAELVEEIRKTIIHEVAHHCGFEEEQLPF